MFDLLLLIANYVMDFIVDAWHVVGDLLSDEEFSVPAMQVFLLMLLNAVCLLLGRFKLGLLVSYCFAFYWGFVFKHDYFVDANPIPPTGLAMYTIGGTGILLVALVGFFRYPPRPRRPYRPAGGTKRLP